MKTIAFWLKFSIFNLFIVSLLGVLMRYKIAFSLPVLDQKHVQDAHSHFAFYGWITTVLYTFMLQYLQANNAEIHAKKYYALISTNVAASIGMLVSFIYGGYFWLSILFSAIALVTGMFYFIFFYRDTQSFKNQNTIWFLGGLFFALISSAGVFLLAYMKITDSVSQTVYLAATYYYLHFQYNGFFIFCCVGLLLVSLQKQDIQFSPSQNKLVFLLSFVGCLIGYGLSVLYLELPFVLFLLIFLGSAAQTAGAYLIVKLVWKHWMKLKINWSPMYRWIIVFAGFSFIAKITLQLLSNIPVLNQFAYGFRNVVIAYLHLVLLLCISSFLVGQIFSSGIFKNKGSVIFAIKLFLLGILLNEIVLGAMGIFSIKYISVPYAAEMLLLISCLIMFALIALLLSLKKEKLHIK